MYRGARGTRCQEETGEERKRRNTPNARGVGRRGDQDSPGRTTTSAVQSDSESIKKSRLFGKRTSNILPYLTRHLPCLTLGLVGVSRHGRVADHH